MVVQDRLCTLIQDAEIPCELVYAESGAAARVRFVADVPQVVVLDIALPDMSGLELLPLLKKARPETIVVIMTTYAFPEFRQRARELGADYFFNKAIEFEKVCDVLRCHLPGVTSPSEETGGGE